MKRVPAHQIREAAEAKRSNALAAESKPEPKLGRQRKLVSMRLPRLAKFQRTARENFAARQAEVGAFAP
jgi:hypothetical protein